MYRFVAVFEGTSIEKGVRGPVSPKQQGGQMSHQAKQRSQELTRGIQFVQDCHRICVETYEYSLRAEGHHVSADHSRILSDCAEICATALTFMLRASRFYPKVSGVCAEVCEACAALCERAIGDQQMQACATVCRTCAQACRQVAALPGV
jgi:hypothetical protein